MEGILVKILELIPESRVIPGAGPRHRPDHGSRPSLTSSERGLPSPPPTQPERRDTTGVLQPPPGLSPAPVPGTAGPDEAGIFLLQLRLINQGSHCYLHSFLLAWLWSCSVYKDPLQCAAPVAKACIRPLLQARKPVRLLSLLPWCQLLRGQRDIAELVPFPDPREDLKSRSPNLGP